MATNLPEIMDAVGVRLNSVDGLRGSGYAPDEPNPPAAFPLIPPFNYRESMRRGTYTINLQVAVLVGAQLDRAGQKRLAGYASQTGATSIRAALEGDKTLGGLVSDLVVDSFDPNGLQDVGLVQYYGGLFNVRVIASGE